MKIESIFFYVYEILRYLYKNLHAAQRKLREIRRHRPIVFCNGNFSILMFSVHPRNSSILNNRCEPRLL